MDAIVEKNHSAPHIKDHKLAEREARRAIEDNCDLIVHDANVILEANCPNIDLVVFAHEAPVYVQVKSSTNPAGKDCAAGHVTAARPSIK